MSFESSGTPVSIRTRMHTHIFVVAGICSLLEGLIQNLKRTGKGQGICDVGRIKSEKTRESER